MNIKRKLIISMLVASFVLLSVIATVAIAFALTQQTIKTTLNIVYRVEDIDGTASATFTVGGVTENLTAMKGTQVIGDKLVFKASDTEDAGNLMFPEDALALTSQNDNVVIQYTYSNTGAKHYIASMDFAANIEADNMKVEYSIDGTTYSEQRYAVVVPANTSNKSYWIKISIADKAKSASFTGDFNWLLNGCDPQSEEYLTLTSTEFQAVEGQTGAYSVSLNGDGYLPGGQVIFPSEVNGDPITTIAQNTSLTQVQKNMVQSVYIPDSVTTIGESAFEDFTNLQTVTFEQNKNISGASAQSVSGLKVIGEQAFAYCYSLTEIIISNSVTSIGVGAFFYCINLVEIVIPNSVKEIQEDSFSMCSALKRISIGSGAEYITGITFSSCPNLESITISANNAYYSGEGNCIVEKASQTLLMGCKNSVIPEGVKVLECDSFNGCSGLTSINIPTSVTAIRDYAFNGCISLTNVIFENPNGWMNDGQEISAEELSDPLTAAEYIKEYYYNNWERH